MRNEIESEYGSNGNGNGNGHGNGLGLGFSNANRLALAGGTPYEASDDAAAAPLTIRRLLRGRMRWAILFTGMGLALGLALGFTSGRRTYRSTAQLRITSVLPQVLYKDDEKNLAQDYEGYVDAQTQLMLSERVARVAMADPMWRQLGRPNTQDAALDLQSNLTAEHKLEIVTLHVDDPTPEGAFAGATTIVNAYQEIYKTDDRENRQRRLGLLEKHKDALAIDLKDIRQRVSLISGTYQPEDLEALHDANLQTVQQMDATRRALSIERASIEAGGASAEEQLSPFLNERAQLRYRINELKAGGLGEGHPQLVILENVLANLEQTIRERLRQPPSKAFEQARTELGGMSGQLKQLSDLRAEEDVVTQQLADTRKRMYQLQVEDEVNNRITVMAAGERPTGPYRDTRKTFGAAGGAAGGLVGFGLALCFCLIDRRFRDPCDLALGAQQNPVVAMIPRLSSASADGEPARRAALAVHHMRMLLHARCGRGGHQAFAVTSAGPGAGKTSITLALGVSFASSGSNTLLIDLDLSGAGLTTSLGAVRPLPLGRLMLRQGLLSEGQLAEAAAVAKAPGRLFGEACVQLGMVSEQDVTGALEAQLTSRVGVMEALAGQPLDECVTDTGIARLSILPLGGATAEHAASLSVPGLARLIEEAKRHYDVVVVDTGPLFGSLEASVVSKAVDGTVLVVSRGEARARAKMGKEMLQSFGATLAGVVFNRAEPQDMMPMALSSASGPSLTNGRRNGNGRLHHFGPIAEEVAKYVPAEHGFAKSRTRATETAAATAPA